MGWVCSVPSFCVPQAVLFLLVPAHSFELLEAHVFPDMLFVCCPSAIKCFRIYFVVALGDC